MKSLLVLTIALTAVVSCKSSGQTAAADEPTQTATQAPEASPAPKGPVPIVVTDAEAEVRTAPGGKATIHKFATGENAFFGKLTMEGGGKVPVHRDATEEYIYILEGSGIMTIDGKEYEVGPNTAIYMPANAEVTFAGGPEKLVALQVFAGPEPSAKYHQWKPGSARTD